MFDAEDDKSLLCTEFVPFELPFLLFVEYVFCNAALVCRLSEGGCSSRGIVFVRPDFLLPSCVMNVDGPSATILFQGGDSGFCRGFDAVSLTRRLLAGRSRPSCASLLSCPFVYGGVAGDMSSISEGVSSHRM